MAIEMRQMSLVCLLVVLLASGGTIHAQVDAPPSENTDIARLVRESAAGLGQATEARRFDLTLDDAIQRALDRNLDIAVERINPLVDALTHIERFEYSGSGSGFFRLDGASIFLNRITFRIP